MNKSNIIFHIIIWSAFLIIFQMGFLPGYAQSGKVNEKPKQTQNQIPAKEKKPATIPNTKPDFSVDPNSPKYKIIFASGYDGKLKFAWNEDAGRKRTRYSNSDKFIEELNKAGEEGYRLVSAIENDFALVKLDETQYEYDWFETNSSAHFAKGDILEKLKLMSNTGFRVIDHFLLSGNCEPILPDDPALGDNCNYLDLFLLEKQKGYKKPFEQILVNSSPGWGAKPSIELETQIDEKLAQGFYPTKVFSKFEILLEKTKNKNDLLNDKPDIQIVRSSWGRSNLEEKVNKLANQGYRLALTNNGIAVMYRNSETAQIPVSYVWVKADKKNFEKNLIKLQEKGAIYRTTYPNEKGTKNSLIFEQKLKSDGQRKEYKILKFKFNYKENLLEKKVFVELTQSSKQNLETLNNLVKKGFEVLDLFDAKEFGIILGKDR